MESLQTLFDCESKTKVIEFRASKNFTSFQNLDCAKLYLFSSCWIKLKNTNASLKQIIEIFHSDTPSIDTKALEISFSENSKATKLKREREKNSRKKPISKTVIAFGMMIPLWAEREQKQKKKKILHQQNSLCFFMNVKTKMSILSLLFCHWNKKNLFFKQNRKFHCRAKQDCDRKQWICGNMKSSLTEKGKNRFVENSLLHANNAYGRERVCCEF